MSKYCLDTNIISNICKEIFKFDEDKKRQQKLIEKIESIGIKNIYTTEINIWELKNWMNTEMIKIIKNNFKQLKPQIKKLYENSTEKDILSNLDKYDIPYDKLDSKDKNMMSVFRKQNKLIEMFEKEKKILKFRFNTFCKYKEIVNQIKWMSQPDHSDWLIASICLENNIILVTSNEKDFRKNQKWDFFEWLIIENWFN